MLLLSTLSYIRNQCFINYCFFFFFFAVNMLVLTHRCSLIHMSMQNECGEAGTTLRKHALSPPSVHGLQTKTVLHGSALKIPDLPHQQHFTLPATHSHAHTHSLIHSLLKPLKCSPKAHQEGRRQLTPATLVSRGR